LDPAYAGFFFEFGADRPLRAGLVKTIAYFEGLLKSNDIVQSLPAM
jgi:hypothetical protein